MIEVIQGHNKETDEMLARHDTNVNIQTEISNQTPADSNLILTMLTVLTAISGGSSCECAT